MRLIQGDGVDLGNGAHLVPDAAGMRACALPAPKARSGGSGALLHGGLILQPFPCGCGAEVVLGLREHPWSQGAGGRGGDAQSCCVLGWCWQGTTVGPGMRGEGMVRGRG